MDACVVSKTATRWQKPQLCVEKTAEHAKRMGRKQMYQNVRDSIFPPSLICLILLPAEKISTKVRHHEEAFIRPAQCSPPVSENIPPHHHHLPLANIMSSQTWPLSKRTAPSISHQQGRLWQNTRPFASPLRLFCFTPWSHLARKERCYVCRHRTLTPQSHTVRA